MTESNDKSLPEKKLTEKENLFCLAYTGEAKFNATKAAQIAGYSEHTATEIGHENLIKPHIKNRNRELTEQRLKDAGYQVDRIIKEIVDIAFADITQFQNKEGKIEIDSQKQPTAAIKEIKQHILLGDEKKGIKTVEIKLHDKKWALEMLSKLLDMKSGDENINIKGIPITEIEIVRVKKEDTPTD